MTNLIRSDYTTSAHITPHDRSVTPLYLHAVLFSSYRRYLTGKNLLARQQVSRTSQTPQQKRHEL